MKTKIHPKLERVAPEVEYTYRDHQKRERDRKRGLLFMTIVEIAVVLTLCGLVIWLGNYLAK